MPDFLFRGPLEEIDPEVYRLIQVEAERQYRRLILIPSESTASLSVRAALGSAFTNIYAEGYPEERTRNLSQSEILDHAMQLARYRRYSDPRYYKGVEYVDAVEALARRRCAELFAANGVSADDIFVNVQALSGAPANNAVYYALVEPGEVVMGMDLLHGGHLTHGSPANRSGRLYQIIHYGVDPESERIDYDAVENLAIQNKPRMIIAGYSSYPWSVDWKRFREIADQVGAYLLADIAHIAGPVAAGVTPSPLGYADVISFTTHKSLCGPRGAAILTTDTKLAKKIDRAVFPGEQGGPHVNNIAAQAVAFALAGTDTFKKLQKQILANCVALTEAMEKEGLRIPYGGTDTHLTNVDCSNVIGADGTALSGDQAARILDLVGIVVNRNTIPGDTSAARPSGIRLGTPWVTQRGFTEAESKQIAGYISRILKACKPYSMAGRRGKLRRTKIDFDVLSEVKTQVRDLALSLNIDFEPPDHGYPHFYYIDDPSPKAPFALLEIHGNEAEGMLRWVTDGRPSEIEEGETVNVTIGTTKKPYEVSLTRLSDVRWQLGVESKEVPFLLEWLRSLSDGFASVGEDLHRKFPGPYTVQVTGTSEERPTVTKEVSAEAKPWFLGISGDGPQSLPDFNWVEPEEELKQTALHSVHVTAGAKMVPFAGWDMPVWYSSVLEEHIATRESAGLFDVSHMGVYQVDGASAAVFLDSVVGNDVASLEVGESLYTQFLESDGSVIDDAMVYRRRDQAYLVVVNASNDSKDWAWLNAVKDGSVKVDREQPGSKAFGRHCRLMNLRDPQSREEMRVDIALQGPKSREILLAVGCDENTADRLKELKWAGVMEGVFGGIDLVISRTGYTGERVAFELFVHPEKSGELWGKIIQEGEAFGLKPVGLGARDSLRTEAGLPLYGHEIAGELGLGVGDAGFGAYVKTYKPWFIGRDAYMQQERERKSEVTRFRFLDKGVRMAHYGDPVLDRRGRVIGVVTSCAVDSEGYLLGQAYLERKSLSLETPISIFQSAPDKPSPAPAALEIGDRTTVPTPAVVLSRFPR